MARKRITESEIVVSSAAAAAPARRKTTTTRPRRAATPKTQPVVISEEPVAVVNEEVVAPAIAIAAPTQDEIAALAYSYWVERGYQDGSPEADWLRAEQELLSRRATA